MRHSYERNALSGVTVSNSSGSATTYRFDNAREDTINTGEVGIRDKFSTGPVKHELSATASIFHIDSRNAYGYGDTLTTNIYNPTSYAYPALTSTSGGDLASPKITDSQTLSSVAIADATSFFDDRLQVTLGIRNQRIKDTGYGYSDGVQNSYYNAGTTTPMAGVVFKLRKDLSVYGNYVEGLKAGTHITDTTASNYGATLAPYKTKQKEIGIKYDAGTVGLTAAVFTMSQPNVFKNTTTNYYGENGNQRNRGVELSAFGTPMRGVRLLTGLTLLDAKQESTSGGTTDGKYVIGAAKTQAKAGVEWDVPGVQGLTVNTRVVYTGTEYLDAANTQQLPSWVRYDLGARYVTTIAGKVVTFRGRIDNVTNKNYWASSGGTYGYLVLGSPRTFVLSAAVDF
jgi:iron complex outermembrane receptor protein